MEKLTDLFVKEEYVTMQFVSTLSWEDIIDMRVPRGLRKTLLKAVKKLPGNESVKPAAPEKVGVWSQ
jgi:hypothetical protein